MATAKEQAAMIKDKINKVAEARPEDLGLGPTPAQDSTQEEGAPFGGGTLVGLIVNPTATQVQELQGYDGHGFSNSRTYGCSLYLPLQQYCSQLVKSDDAIDRMTGYKHLGDRFMVRRDTSPPFTEAEEQMYEAAQQLGQKLLERGALPPLTFPPVSVFGHTGQEPLEGFYVPSCGYAKGSILQKFQQLMKDPEVWLTRTREEMTHLKAAIDKQEAAPIRGYTK